MGWPLVFVDSIRFSLKCAFCTFLPMLGGCLVSFGSPVHPPSKPIEAHFEMRHGVMLIEAAPSRPGSYFLFDTGSMFCLLDPGSFPDLHYDIDIDLSFGIGDTSTNRLRDVYPPPHVSAGPFDVASYPGCEATDLKGASQVAGVPVIGVLGAITFGGGILQIDFSKSILRIFPSDGREHPEWGAKRRMDAWSSALFNLNGQNVPLVVDTGNNYFMAADPSLFSALRQIRGVEESSDRGFTVKSGLSSWRRLVLKHLTVDGRTYSNSVIVAAPFTTSTLGTGFLKNFIVTLDCVRGYLYLKPANPSSTSTTAISSVPPGTSIVTCTFFDNSRTSYSDIGPLCQRP